ncbi:MAG: Uma2 family endonuclease [Acidobacteria bacterium]|nr:Uma2 family endonuclease [Acidobacteriota bacterium]
MTTPRLTTTEYNHLVETGVLTKDDRIELLNGVIYQKPRVTPKNSSCVMRLDRAIYQQFGSKTIISRRGPIELPPDSEPEPDFALLRYQADYYAEAHPSSADILLIIEVADSALERQRDRDIKLPIYARAGIQETWLVNLPESRIEIYTSPADEAYQEMRTVQREQTVESAVLPQLKLAASDILPKS